jgi:hypothetical protein
MVDLVNRESFASGAPFKDFRFFCRFLKAGMLLGQPLLLNTTLLHVVIVAAFSVLKISC